MDTYLLGTQAEDVGANMDIYTITIDKKVTNDAIVSRDKIGSTIVYSVCAEDHEISLLKRHIIELYDNQDMGTEDEDKKED